MGCPKGTIPAKKATGRPKGVPNKLTSDVKAMILAALHGAGGADYLREQATKNPVAFMALIGKVLPLTVQGPGEHGELTISWLSPSK